MGKIKVIAVNNPSKEVCKMLLRQRGINTGTRQKLFNFINNKNAK
jgi:hypothetical protein